MRNKPRLSLPGLVLVILFMLSGIAIGLSSAPNQALSTPAVSLIATESRVQPGRGPAYVVIERSGTIAHPWYPISSPYHLRFLQLDESIPSAGGFNSLLKRFVDGQYYSFEVNAVQNPPVGDTQFLGASLTLDFRTDMWSDDLLSVQLYGQLGLDGTVRPGAYTDGINYSLKQSKELLLADLFDPTTNWLGFIENYTLAELLKQKLTLAQGVALADIWEWNVTDQGLLFTFDDVQFDRPTSTMPPEVTIPYTALRQFVNASSPLSTVFQK